VVRVSGVPYEIDLAEFHFQEMKKAWNDGYTAGYKAALEKCEKEFKSSFVKLKENVA
jgi:hypothetical protein